MKTSMHRIIVFLVVVCSTLNAAPQTEDSRNAADQPALTIYNANFAVVRQNIPLDLKAGTNRVSFTDATAHIEPDSVILRDPQGRRTLQILEQNYRNDPVTQERLLALFEGKVIDFQVQRVDAQGQVHNDVVQGKIIRSGYVPHYTATGQYGQQYYQQQVAYATSTTPIIEVNGTLPFNPPGLPHFPTIGDNTILKPTLDWAIQTDKPGSGTGELSDITGGMSWHAAYNQRVPTKGGNIRLMGWST